MRSNNSKRTHIFQFPGSTGSISLSLTNGCFPDVSSDELFSIGKVLRDFLYGLMVEDREQRENFLNIFHSVLKDGALMIEDRDMEALRRYSEKMFRDGDYTNALFLSKYILARINTIIDNKIAQNSNKIDRETIQLQISTLNFIGYLFAKLRKNIDYGLKLVLIANKLLDEFDENNVETRVLRAAILDTIGVLYIEKHDWVNAIEYLTDAHEYDTLLLSMGHVDPIGFRLTCSNLGYALINLCDELLNRENGSINIHEIEDSLRKAKLLFNMVRVDQHPIVPEQNIKDLELLSAMKRMKDGLKLVEKVRKRLQRRLI